MTKEYITDPGCGPYVGEVFLYEEKYHICTHRAICGDDQGNNAAFCYLLPVPHDYFKSREYCSHCGEDMEVCTCTSEEYEDNLEEVVEDGSLDDIPF